MLAHKRKIQTDSEHITSNKKKDVAKIHMTDINKIEQSVDESTKCDGINNMEENKEKHMENILNLGMNVDQSMINSKSLDPTTNNQHTVYNNGFHSQKQQIHQNIPIRHQLTQQHQQHQHQQNYQTNNPGYVINVQQTLDRDSIIVETIHNQKRFDFYDRNKNFLGGFSIYEFVKYVTSNVSSEFLSGINYDSVIPIIEKYVCNIKKIEYPSKRFVINMLTYLESPFMGNIETLIKFYTFIHDFETSKFDDELSKLDQHESNQTRDIFNNMLYTLLNHILKIIAILTNKLDPTDINAAKIRSSLLNYSVAIVYRLSKFAREDINKKVDELNVLNNDLLRIEGIRTTVNSRIDSVQRLIDKQNAEIDILFRHLMFRQNQNLDINMINNREDNREDNNFNVLLQNDIDDFKPTTFPIKDSQLTPVTSLSDLSERISIDSSCSELSTMTDKSYIYNEGSESGKKMVKNDNQGMMQKRSENLRVSELFENLNNIRSQAETQEKIADSNNKRRHYIANNRKNNNSDDKNPQTLLPSFPLDVVIKPTQLDLHKRNTNISSDTTKTLNDILNIHNTNDYGTQSENYFKPSNNGKLHQFKYLNQNNTSHSELLAKTKVLGNSWDNSSNAYINHIQIVDID
jgi:hypothetical protein